MPDSSRAIRIECASGKLRARYTSTNFGLGKSMQGIVAETLRGREGSVENLVWAEVFGRARLLSSRESPGKHSSAGASPSQQLPKRLDFYRAGRESFQGGRTLCATFSRRPSWPP